MYHRATLVGRELSQNLLLMDIPIKSKIAYSCVINYDSNAPTVCQEIVKTTIHYTRVWALSKCSNAVYKELELCSGKMYTFVIHVSYIIHERV